MVANSTKASPKQAAKPAAPGKAPAPAKPSAKAAGNGDAALPDAALLDREQGDPSDSTEAASTRRASWLPTGPWRWAAIAAVSLIVAGGAAAAAFVGMRRAPEMPSTIAGPAEALSGATLVVDGETLRLDGIDAPPADLVCRDGKWEYKCGEESRRALEQVVRGRQIECARTGVANGAPSTALCMNDQGQDLAAALVEGGWAVIDIKRSARYMPQQARAQAENRGLWRNDFALPEQWRLSGKAP